MYFLFRDNTLISAYNHLDEFDKNANSPLDNCVLCTHFHIELVWRLSEFAFFVRLLRWSHFLFSFEGRTAIRLSIHTHNNIKKERKSIMGWYIFGAMVGLFINLFICFKFAEIAAEKGYSKAYFWLGFFFGAIGFPFLTIPRRARRPPLF